MLVKQLEESGSMLKTGKNGRRRYVITPENECASGESSGPAVKKMFCSKSFSCIINVRSKCAENAQDIFTV